MPESKRVDSKPAADQLLSGILGGADPAVLTISPDGIIQGLNPAARRLFGYDGDELIGQNVSVLMPEPHRDRHDEYLRHYLATGEPNILGLGRQLTGRHRNGSTFPLHLSVSEFRADGHRYFTGVAHDMSASTAAEDMLTRLGQIIEDSVNEIYVFDDTTLRFLNVNRGARTNLGYSHVELARMTPRDLKPDFTADQFEQLIAPLRRGEKDRVQFQTLHRRRDGTTYPVEVNLHYSLAVKPAVFVAIVLDITERQQAERALRQSEQRLALVLEATTDGWWDRDLVTGEEQWSEGTFRLFGYEPGEVAPAMQLFRQWIHPDDLARRDRAIEAHIQNGEPFKLELRYRKKDGEYIWIRAAGETLHDRSGRPYRMIGTLTDISEVIEKEEQLQRAARLETVGQLTGGIAHDFNNLLTVITGNLDLLDRKLADPSLKDLVAQINEAAEMGARLTDRLLTFARRRHLEPRTISINDLITSLAEMLQRTVGEPVEFVTELSPDAWMTRADQGQLKNAVLNLVINARDAMPRGGRLVIQTGNERLEPADTAGVPDLSPGEYVQLTVADDGQGMSAEVLERAFEPFFTTKETGLGNGLGLSMIYGFARQSGGHVAIRSEVGRGTVVKLFLPRSLHDEPVTAADPPEPKESPGAVILVVEDDDRVLRLTTLRLELLGYRVLKASTGQQALGILQQGEEIDLLFTDLVMRGGMSGLELCEQARQQRPTLKMLLTSGYSQDHIGAADLDSLGLQLLEKPYRGSDLDRVVRLILSAAPGRT